MTELDNTFNDKLFDAHHALSKLEDALYEYFEAICGEGVFDAVTHDYYDNSMELKGVRNDWEPPADFGEKVKALGFCQYWICFKDGTEIYCNGQRRPGPRLRSEMASKQKQTAVFSVGSLLAEDRKHRAELGW